MSMTSHFSRWADGVKLLYLGLVDYEEIEACILQGKTISFVRIPINIRVLLYKAACINVNIQAAL